MGRKSFVASTLILVLTGVIIKALGFFYRVYLSNLIGAEGMGLFQLISPVYSTVILTLTAGISIAVSRLTANEIGRQNYINLRRITSIGLIVITIASVLVSALMYINRNFITQVVLKDSRTYLSLTLLIPLIPIIAGSSAIKGYFYGIQDVMPSAAAQIIEQLVKMGFVMFIAQKFVQKDIVIACAVAIGGMAAGEIASFIFIFIRYKFYRYRTLGGRRNSVLSILMSMLSIAVPISANRFITSVMSAVEVILIPRRLVAAGLSYRTAMEEYGKLMGMAIPLIYMPSIITSALSVTLVPAISESLSSGSTNAVRHRTCKAIKLTAVAGCICTLVFMSFSYEISQFVYRGQNIGHILYLLSFTCIFIYLQQTLIGIMNGLGKQAILFWNTVIGLLIRIAFVYFMVPRYGMAGYVWGMIVSLSMACVVNLWCVASCAGISINITEWLIKPAVITCLMLPFGRHFYYLINIFNIHGDLKVIVAVTIEVGVMALLMIIAKVINIDEMLEMVYIKRRK